MKFQVIKKYVLFFSIFILMFYLNSQFGFCVDEFHFLFVRKDFYPTSSERPISSFYDIILSVKNYYLMSGGRALNHFFDFCFTNLPKWIFNIVNSVMFVLLGTAVKKVAFKNKPVSVFCQFMIYFSLFSLLSYFGDNIIWLSGAINYLWPSVLFLTAIYLCEKFIDSEKLSDIIPAIAVGG